MRRTRLLVVGIPQLLCDIITDTLADDMEVVTILPDLAMIVRAIDQTEIDVVILTLANGELPAECADLFDAHPRIKLVGVVDRGRQVFLYELRRYRTALGEVSPRELVAVIRRTMGGTATGVSGSELDEG